MSLFDLFVNDGQVCLARSVVISHLSLQVKLAACSTELATCSAGIERQGQDLLHALCHYALWAKILVDFNLPVSTLTAKLPNLMPCQIFCLYSTVLTVNKST